MDNNHELYRMMNFKPDSKMQLRLGGLQLEELLSYKEKGNDETKQLAQWELDARYRPCVNGKDDKIQMNPHYLHSTEWQTAPNKYGVNEGNRNCVTYEDPDYPTPEWYEYTDRISKGYDDTRKNAAKVAADLSAKPQTARWWEIYLSSLHEKNIRVNRVITGIRNDGYSWNVIGQSEILNIDTAETRQSMTETIKQ